MQRLFCLACAFMAMLVLATGAVPPGLATPMAGGCAGMAMDAPMPDEKVACDMACLACLVDPGQVRVPESAPWSQQVRYALGEIGFSGVIVAPEVPPPRAFRHVSYTFFGEIS